LGGNFTCNKTLATVLGNIIGMIALGAIATVIGISVSSSSNFKLEKLNYLNSKDEIFLNSKTRFWIIV
jgi:hypothetical protein